MCPSQKNQVSEQENEKRKNDALSWLKNEELVNDDANNVEEADDNDWDAEVASARVEVKKIKLVSEKVNEKRKNDALSKKKVG
jgi:hypothetical protein